MSDTAARVLRYGELDARHLTASLLSLARRVGVDKVTMRALAGEAGTGTSSVYYYVKDKTELLDLLIESVLSQVAIPASGAWDERLHTLYVNAWQALIAIPGIAGLLQRRPLTLAAARMDGEARKALREAGLRGAALDGAHSVLFVHLLGSVELSHRLQQNNFRQHGERDFVYGLRVILSGVTLSTKETGVDDGDT